MVAAETCDPGRLAGLLFVTSEQAVADHWADDVRMLKDLVGDRMVVMPSPLVDCHEAAQHVRPALERDTSIKGVVILGDYVTVPSRRMLSLDAALLEELRGSDSDPCSDADHWWVWSDDIYGDRDGDGVPDLPVSRLPINPALDGTSGAAFAARSFSRHALGLRASEFPFADAIYCEFMDRDEMRQSPPDAQNAPRNHPDPGNWPTLQPGDLAAERLYLVLHGMDGGEMHLKGTAVPDWTPIAVDGPVVGGEWHSPGVIVGGICWVALVARPMARWAEPGTPVEPRTVENSFPLAFLMHGANAFIGFTTWHYIPEQNAGDVTLGGRLHWNVWENITRHNLPPAQALFQARARFIRDTNVTDAHPLDRAIAMKSFWSATCLGFGW